MFRVNVRVFPVGGAAALLAASLFTATCRKAEPAAPPVATPKVTLSHDRVIAGSALEITYRFDVAPDARFPEDYRVFAHVVDADGEQMWNDDHDPPISTTQWKGGQAVEYKRTIFVPIFPYVGDATIQVGLHSTKDNRRLPMTGETSGQRAYRVARLQLLPQTENLFTVFKEGWHPVETSPNPSVEWQWSKKQGTIAFKNPKTDSLLYLDLDSPMASLHPAQQVQVAMGGQVLEEFSLSPDVRLLRKVKLPAAQMGSGDLAELQIGVDKTFVPADVSPSTSKDPRELGVRVFHAYIDPHPKP
jgi:hypothetical protein